MVQCSLLNLHVCTVPVCIVCYDFALFSFTDVFLFLVLIIISVFSASIKTRMMEITWGLVQYTHSALYLDIVV